MLSDTAAMFNVRVVFPLLLFAFTHASIDEAVDVIRLGKEIGEEVLKSWDILSKPFNLTDGVKLLLIRRREDKILSRLANISNSIRRLELDIEKTGTITLFLAKNVGRGTRLELKINEMTDLLNRVSAADKTMREYMRYRKKLERSTLQDFAEWCVSHDPGALPGLLERINALIVPPHSHILGIGILELILHDLQEDHPDLCELQMSPHQLIYDMYNTISLTEIKGYAMMQFSRMLLRIYGKGNFTQEASITRKRYAERMSRTAVTARATLAMARRDVYRCDPPEHKLGETYAEVTRLLQGYIDNEVNFNTDGTCWKNCGYYTLTEQHGCYYPSEEYCSKQAACKGRLINCQFIDSDMWICPAGRRSKRRYEFIEYENGRMFGKGRSCRLDKVDSWRRWIFWQCSYCMCLCDETGPTSDRYFSLWDATSDVKNNKLVPHVDSWWRGVICSYCSYCMCLFEETVSLSERSFSLREALAEFENNKVVTGIRIVKHGQVFHLQVSEGQLGERGNVTSGNWVPVQKFAVTDAAVREGVDYHTLTYEKRAVDLDELDSPVNHILTGVRFRMIGPHLHFEIRSTPFNYTTGRLSPEKSVWISNDNTDGSDTPRSKLELVKPDIPIHSSVPLRVDSKHDQYVEFTHSDFEADAAQSTVPFIDIQPLEPMKGSALLSGAGLLHRGARGSGGFLGVKVVAYDQSRHVSAPPPPTDSDADVDFSPPVQ